MFGMTGQVDFTVATDDPTVALDEDRGVVAVERALLLGQLGITQIEANTELGGEIEERPGLRARHLAFEEAIDLLLVGHPITREEGRQRELGEDDELGAAGMRFAHQRHQPLDDGGTRIGEMDRPELGDGCLQFTGHEDLLQT